MITFDFRRKPEIHEEVILNSNLVCTKDNRQAIIGSLVLLT
jgi:hypothetical protein